MALSSKTWLSACCFFLFSTFGNAQSGEHLPEYDRLYEDGKLDVLVAIGFEEDGWYKHTSRQLRGWIEAQAGRFLTHQPLKSGLELYYWDKEVYNSVSQIRQIVRINIHFISPMAGAAKEFMTQLPAAEVVIYLGHARGGLGPDFDHINSAAEQVVFGKGSRLHKEGIVKVPEDDFYKTVSSKSGNDLEKMLDNGAWSDPDKYRIWLFDACRTRYYVDEFRKGLLPAAMNSRNLDLIVTKELAPIDAYADTGKALLANLFEGATVEHLIQSLNNLNNEYVHALAKRKPQEKASILRSLNVFMFDGETDNTMVY